MWNDTQKFSYELHMVVTIKEIHLELYVTPRCYNTTLEDFPSNVFFQIKRKKIIIHILKYVPRGKINKFNLVKL